MQTSSADQTRLVTKPTRLACGAHEAERLKTKEAHTQIQKKSTRLSVNMHNCVYSLYTAMTYSKAAQSRQQVQQRSLSHEDLYAINTARAAKVHIPTMQYTATCPSNYQNQQTQSSIAFHLVTHSGLLFLQLCIQPRHQV